MEPGTPVVFIHGTSPVMTVVRKNNEKTVQCGWFDKRHIYQETMFNIEFLKKANIADAG